MPVCTMKRKPSDQSTASSSWPSKMNYNERRERSLCSRRRATRRLAASFGLRGPGLEMLARYGDDLLSAVASLERHGVAHRDIKPDNIGIRSLQKQRNN